MERLDQFLARLEQADDRFAATVIKIMRMFDKRFPTDDKLRVAKTLWTNDIPSFGCLSTGPTPILQHGRLSITETRAVIGSEGEPWFDRTVEPKAIIAIRITLMVEPGILGTPMQPLHIVKLCELEQFFSDNPAASDEDALAWIGQKENPAGLWPTGSKC